MYVTPIDRFDRICSNHIVAKFVHLLIIGMNVEVKSLPYIFLPFGITFPFARKINYWSGLRALYIRLSS